MVTDRHIVSYGQTDLVADIPTERAQKKTAIEGGNQMKTGRLTAGIRRQRDSQ